VRQIILDTGPLVAAINRQDNYHEWTTCQLADIRPPLLTCEAVVSEACFLLRDHGDGIRALFEWMENGVMSLAFRLDTETEQIGKLMKKYADVPMALADACLVRMSEIHNFFPGWRCADPGLLYVTPSGYRDFHSLRGSAS